MLKKEEIKKFSEILDEIIDNKDSLPFRAPVDYKGKHMIRIVQTLKIYYTS